MERGSGIILKESIRFRAEKENSFIQKIKLLGMWFFPIVPIRGRAAGMYMGIVSFPAPLNRRILWKKAVKAGLCYAVFVFKGMLHRPSAGRSWKTVWKNAVLSGSRMHSSKLLHGSTAALRADAWIFRLSCPCCPVIGNRKSVFKETAIPDMETINIYSLECKHAP